MKICQFSETFYPVVDGVGRVVYSYAKELGERGHESYVVTPMIETGYRGSFPFEIVDYVAIDVPKARQYKTGIAALDRHYKERIMGIELELIHVHTPFATGLEGIRQGRKRKVPVVGTFHSKYYEDFYKATKSESIAKIGAKGVARFYEKCTEVWAVSRKAAETLRSYGYRGGIEIMENGTEIMEGSEKEAAAAAAEYGIDRSKAVLLYVGQIDEKKNLVRIMEAGAGLKEAGAEFSIILVGQGRDSRKIAAKAGEYGIKERVKFTGHITEGAKLRGLYQNATVLVFPSVYDSAPMVVREAAALGIPSVVTKGSAAAEVIKDGENGIIAEDTAEGLRNGIWKVLRDRELGKRIGEGARRDIPIGWERIMERVEERYERLIKEKGGG